ncbi:glycosyltransferase family 2 protein [Bradyrhizobium sp. CCBAU 45389]|uniref:glycosyltransferase family 2 protein n=1 Tax=Bradyrhizobium sp. CCBAU 45389 TaxID=858429 RepID=UPI003FA44331
MTIAIPTYNRAALLKGCVGSALSQTYPHFEILVSNNASPDDTSRVLSGFKDPRLRIINQATNIGLLPNWNACLANARGDYIVFVSDDDRIMPWLLERCATLIRQQPQLSSVITLSNLHAASLGHTRPPRASRLCATGVRDGTIILKDFLTDQITVNMCGVVMRTELLRRRGGIPLDLPHTADVAAWAPLLLLGRAGLINEACATYTYHDDSETARLGVEQLLNDGRRVADLIAQTAEVHVQDLELRKTIQIEAKRCFARRGLITLSDFRKSGGSIQEILEVAWRFRRDLYDASLKAVLRFVVLSLCPRSLTARLRRLRHSTPEQLA